MRLCELQQRKRNDLAWYCLSCLVVQAALAVGVDQSWEAVRDPDYAELAQLFRVRQAEASARPLVVALGSSRTLVGLHTARLNNPADRSAPLVVNCAVFAGGPMTSQILLRRMLGGGVRPRLICMEIMPMSLSRRDGAALEERPRYWNSARLTAGEVVRLWPYYREPYRLLWPWASSRALPAYRYQPELRESLGVDLPASGQRTERTPRDAFASTGNPRTFLPEQIERMTRVSLQDYDSALKQPALAPGAVRALRDVLRLCRDEGIAMVLVVPPEGQAFRSYCPAAEEAHMKAIGDLADDFHVRVVDARAWVEDDGFFDGHHLDEKGAEKYTDRFRREVLAVHLSPEKPASAPSIVRTGP